MLYNKDVPKRNTKYIRKGKVKEMFKIEIIKNGVAVGAIKLAQKGMTFGDLKKFKEIFGVELKGKFVKEVM